MSIFQNTMLAGSATQFGPYEIDQSIRFNQADSARLTRTPASAGNRKTFTFSCWLKRGKLSSIAARFFTGYQDVNNQFEVYFNASDKLIVAQRMGGTWYEKTTNAVYRDPSAWYHFVWYWDTTDGTAEDRSRAYINGERVTFASGSNPSLNADGMVNATIQHEIAGEQAGTAYYYDGYMAEIHLIDGQALDPTSFGKTDSTTGQWVPIEYTGSYGTNGFYITGADSADLGADDSGNGNDFTSSGLAAADQVTDSPTDNHCVLNALDGAGTLSDGNLVNAATGASFVNRRMTFGVPSAGKWAFRVKKSANNFMVGVIAPQQTDGDPDQNNIDAVFYYDKGGTSSGDIQTRRTGTKVVETTNPPAGIAADTFMEVLIDKDNNRLGVVIGGTSYIAVDSGVAIQDTMTQIFVATAGSGVTATVDFGQSGFTPSQAGYKALSTANLPDPTIADPSAYFQTLAYASTGTSTAFVQDGNSQFEPGLVWVKSRTGANNHLWFDQVRGATKFIRSDTTNAENTVADTLTAFNSNGFTAGADSINWGINYPGRNNVAWMWAADGTTGSSNTDGDITSTVSANTTSGVGIVKYAGNLSTTGSATVGHGLGTAPSVVISKSLDSTAGDSGGWSVQHTSLAASNILRLNTTDATSSKSANGTLLSPTSTVFYTNYTEGLNVTGNDYIAYCFAEVEGFSKFGSYTGNGSTNGAFIYTGFEVGFLMYKRTNAAESWEMYDNTRGYNVHNFNLRANLPNTEQSDVRVDLLSNGFKARSSNTAINASGSTYIYMAFASSPFKTATAQ